MRKTPPKNGQMKSPPRQQNPHSYDGQRGSFTPDSGFLVLRQAIWRNIEQAKGTPEAASLSGGFRTHADESGGEILGNELHLDLRKIAAEFPAQQRRILQLDESVGSTHFVKELLFICLRKQHQRHAGHDTLRTVDMPVAVSRIIIDNLQSRVVQPAQVFAKAGVDLNADQLSVPRQTLQDFRSYHAGAGAKFDDFRAAVNFLGYPLR
jgi:hypothetical protein